ncbi:Rho GTPase activation protein [Penicillium maclennaniae]|uniref:Rho GTPase activation protein n=1 Tax=Penicillium maclennaniae TaxID=1343394 RepID=UPI002540F219|nr:Rho GTPase activation protein [Penicillium maclennaniae]KAJ5678103.1 Rho GTPase activation protein [Penicillium maclennaniae]
MSTGNLNLPSGLHLPDTGSTVGPSPFTAPNAFSGEFLGLPINEDEPQFWGLSPISPTMGMAWDTKPDATAFASSTLERDLKNAQVRNGQPTPPPYDDHARDLSSLEFESASKRRRLCESKTAADSLSPDLDDLPPQERAKRAKFLERNRLAASKCRQKKKEHTQKLEYRFKEQSEKKERLQGEIASLRSQILSLKNEVLKHAQCGDEPIKLHLAQMVKKITDSDGPPPAPAPAPAPVDPPLNIVDHIPVSPPRAPPTLPPTKTPMTSQAATTSNLSFGFDPLQLEPAAVAAAEAFEQQLRRNSEASLVSESSYTFSADDTFDDLINV